VIHTTLCTGKHSYDISPVHNGFKIGRCFFSGICHEESSRKSGVDGNGLNQVLVYANDAKLMGNNIKGENSPTGR
jgi:hypothetical protein